MESREFLETLYRRYRQYDEELRQARAKASPGAGLMGLGDDPRRHPCNMAFFEDIGIWCGEFLRSEPETAAVEEAVEWILRAAEESRGKETFPFLFAAQGHARALIPLLPARRRGELARWYDRTYPKKQRLPVQEEVYRLLKK